jgi:hypothetical protein
MDQDKRTESGDRGMKNSLKKQEGMTFAGWLIVLVLIGFFALLGMKLVPIYLEHYTVKTVIESLRNEPLITKQSANEVRQMIMRRLDINGVYDLKKEHVAVKKSPGILHVNIAYQVQRKMVGNIDVLISFSDEIELVSN